MGKKPLISCTMITKNRWNLCKRAISCFKNQTYTHKQLVIVSDGKDEYNNKIIEFISNCPNIKIIIINPQKYEDKSPTLGHLRNISLDNADGEYIVQWDDDDISHNSRIEKQFDIMQKNNKDISIFKDYMLLLPNKEPIKITFPK